MSASDVPSGLVSSACISKELHHIQPCKATGMRPRTPRRRGAGYHIYNRARKESGHGGSVLPIGWLACPLVGTLTNQTHTSLRGSVRHTHASDAGEAGLRKGHSILELARILWRPPCLSCWPYYPWYVCMWLSPLLHAPCTTHRTGCECGTRGG